MAKISVIIPVYNTEKYLARCLDSVTSQSFDDIEIICVNDGSYDNSLKILEQYSKFDKRIKIFSRENTGAYASLGYALTKISSDYVFFVDSDDYIANSALEKLYDCAVKNDADLVIYDFIFASLNNKNDVRISIKKLSDCIVNSTFNINDIGSVMYKYIPVFNWIKLYKRELTLNMKFENKIVCQDLVFWADVYTHAKRIIYLKEPLYYYNNNNPSGSQNNLKENVCDVIIAYDKVEEIMKNTGYFDECKYELQTMRIIDYMKKFGNIAPVYRKIFFDKLKQHGIELDSAYFVDKNILPVEKRAIEIFKDFNNINFDEFCTKLYGVTK